MAYDEDSESLYFLGNGWLYNWRIHSAAPIFPVSTEEIFDVKVVSGAVYATQSAGGTLLLRDISLTAHVPITDENRDVIAFGKLANQPIDPNAILLRLLTNPIDGAAPAWHMKYVDDFLVENGNTPIQLSAVSVAAATDEWNYNQEQYYDNLAKKLLAGDSDFDLFIVGGSNYQFLQNTIENILHKDYLYALDTLGLSPQYNDMLPGIKNLCTVDGQLSLAPLYFHFNALTMNAEDAKAVGVNPAQVPRLAQPFIQYVLDIKPLLVREKMALQKSLYTDIFTNWFGPQYSIGFMEGTGSSQTAVDAMLDYSRQLFDTELFDFDYELLDGMPAYNGAIIDYTETLFVPNDGSILIGSSRTEINTSLAIPMPLLDANAKYPLHEGLFLAVNPYTKNPEAVRAYLEALLSWDYQEFLIQKRRLQTGEYNLIGLSFLLYDEPMVADDQNFAVYKEMMANSSRGYENYYYYVWYKDFMDGKMTNEAVRASIDRGLEFLRDE